MPVWMNLKCFMLRERIQTQEGIYYKVSSKWHPRRSKGIRTENGSVVASGNRWGWERLQRAREMIGGDRAMIACTHLSELAELYTENGGLCKWHLKKLQKKKDDVTLLFRTFQFVLLTPHNCPEGPVVLTGAASLISSFPDTFLLTHPMLVSLFSLLFPQISVSFCLRTFAHAVPLLECSSPDTHRGHSPISSSSF